MANGARQETIRLGKEDGNLMDKKWEPVPKARAGGTRACLSHKAVISKHAQDMI